MINIEVYKICLERLKCKKICELVTLQKDLTQVRTLISLWIPQTCCWKYLFQRVLNEKPV